MLSLKRNEEVEGQQGLPEQLQLSLSVCQALLRRSLMGSPCTSARPADSSLVSIVDHLHEEFTKVKRQLDQSFVLKLSTTLIMTGSSKVTMNKLLETVLQSYGNDTSALTSTSCAKASSYLVKVYGSLHGNDQDAILDAVDQLYSLRAEHRRDGSVAIEDLENLFRQCKLDGIPAILVMEDIHVFAARTRQTLLYTLLDLMHRKDCLFVVSC